MVLRLITTRRRICISSPVKCRNADSLQVLGLSLNRPMGKELPMVWGGALKRAANRKVTENMDVPDAITFYHALKPDSKIELFYIPEEKVQEL